MNRPIPASASVSTRLKRQPRRDTKPELELRRRLFSLGYRYRVNYPTPMNSRRTIDIAFTRAKVAIFVDGCFWHGCPSHFVPPKNNSEWWAEKIARNKMRDSDTREELVAAGWVVVSVWEHEGIVRASEEVERALESRRLGEISLVSPPKV